MRPSAEDESGLTLIELLVVISILGVISFALTEAVILGLKTTDGITNDVSNSVAVQALRSYVTADIQKAAQVSEGPTDPTDSCAPDAFFLKLTEADARRVWYLLDGGSPPVAGQAELVRWSCAASSMTADKRILGHFDFDPAGDLPVLARCSPDCATATTVTLTILTNRPRDPPAPIELTVRRRVT